MLVDYAAHNFGTTAESLSPAEVHELVFEVFPRKVSVEPKAAPAIIAGLRAFLVFLEREYPGDRARRRVAILDGNASQRLARLLADPSNFGPAKAFMMSGRAAGFDMSSQAGLDAWAEHMRKNNAGANLGELGSLLVDRHVHAQLAEEPCGSQSPDAGAHDSNPQV